MELIEAVEGKEPSVFTGDRKFAKDLSEFNNSVKSIGSRIKRSVARSVARGKAVAIAVSSGEEEQELIDEYLH